MAAAALFSVLFLSISSLVLSFPFQATADSPQSTTTTTDFLNCAPPLMQPLADDQNFTGLLPELPIAPTVAAPTVSAPVEGGNEPSVNVAAPTVGAPAEVGNEPSETDAAPIVGALVNGGNKPSETDAAPTVDTPVEGGNEPSVTAAAPTVGAHTVEGGEEPSEGSVGSSVSGGAGEQEPSNQGSRDSLAPSASPVASTPAAAATIGGVSGPFGQRQRQQQLKGGVNGGEEQDLGAQPLVDNTPFDSGSTKMGYFSWLGYTTIATLAFMWFPV